MPKIAQIELLPLEFALPADKAYGTSRGLNFRRQSSLVKLTTEDGVVGYGEAQGPARPIGDYLEVIKGYFVGRSLYDAELVAAFCRDRLYHFGEGHFTGCAGAVTIAAYDAMGKTLGLPVHDLIGGRAVDRIPCYATTGYVTKGSGLSLEAQLEKVDKTCFVGAKIKIGISPQSDVERVRIARRILGDDMLLMVDINGNYTVDIALQSLRAIEQYNIHWAEEPLPAYDLAGHTELRARSPIPIATGEGMHSFNEFRHLIEARGVDIVQPALGRCGGFGHARAVAALASAANIRLAPAVWGGAFTMAAGIHFLVSCPNTPHTDNAPFPRMLEFDIADNPLRDDVALETFRPQPGGLPVPTGPGLGVTLDPDRVARYRAKA